MKENTVQATRNLGMELWRALGANVRETYECYWFLGAQRRK
jgi:hypothetical protein